MPSDPSDLMRFAAELTARLKAMWGEKTLAEFRDEAEAQETGILFGAVRDGADGPRVVLAACIADIDQIAEWERVFELVDAGPPEDWNTLTLFDAVLRALRCGGFSFESTRDEYGRRNALVLICAAMPLSKQMRLLENTLGLTP